jgi:hypothetical protein
MNIKILINNKLYKTSNNYMPIKIVNNASPNNNFLNNNNMISKNIIIILVKIIIIKMKMKIKEN